MRYFAEWKGFDRGREGVLYEPLWTGVLEILAKHEGEDYRDEGSPLYGDLEERFPDEKWIGDGDHQFFRDYSTAWTLTGVLETRDASRPGIKLTALGHAVVKQRISRAAVLLKAVSSLEEQSPTGTEKPFRILAEAFSLLPNVPLTLEEIYFGIEAGWRPGDGDPLVAVRQAELLQIPPTPRRRLRAILKILVELGAIKVSDGRWIADSNEILDAIISGTAVNDKVLQQPPVAEIVQPTAEISEAEVLAIKTGEFESIDPQIIKERVLRSITVRRGQPRFRAKLLKLYNGRCAISNYDAPEALEAAHVLAVSQDGTHEARNGLLLRADLHTLFDLHLIGVNPADWTVVVSNSLAATSYGKFGGRKVSLPAGLLDRPAAANLQQHLSLIA